jgi:hypothetical protein
MPTVYRIFEKPADSEYPGHETRVYVDKQLAEEHVTENHDPELKRWIEPQDT